MTNRIAEIGTFPTELEASPESMQRAFQVFEGVPGFLGVYHGVSDEDPSIAYWISEWESMEYRNAFVNDEEKKTILAAMRAAAENTAVKDKLIDIPILLDPAAGDSSKVFEAPVMGILVMKLREGVDRSRLEPIFQGGQASIKATEGVVAAVWGTSSEDGDTFVTLTGWDSIEAHKAALAASENAPQRKEFMEIVEFTSARVELTEIKGE